MPELRWILVGFAIVLLAGIYLWGRRSSAEIARREPSLDADTAPEPTFGNAHADAHAGSDVREEMAPVRPDEAEPSSRPFAASTGSYPRTIVRESEGPDRALRGAHDTWRGRVEPTLSDASVTVELTSESGLSETEAPNDVPAPTLSTAETPPPKRIERRKILALRLAASPHRLDGARLLEALQAESLQHGKYEVFHRLHEDGTSIFSVASMVEPGTFDLEKMPGSHYPGVTLFAQLPGPVPGMHALNELIACARRLQQALGGTLQDDRGVPLTVHRIERLRQEVREFERPQSQASASRTSGPSRRT